MDTEGLGRRPVWRGNDADLNLVTAGFKRDSRALQELGMVEGWVLGDEGQVEKSTLLVSSRYGITPRWQRSRHLSRLARVDM